MKLSRADEPCPEAATWFQGFQSHKTQGQQEGKARGGDGDAHTHDKYTKLQVLSLR